MKKLKELGYMVLGLILLYFILALCNGSIYTTDWNLLSLFGFLSVVTAVKEIWFISDNYDYE